MNRDYTPFNYSLQSTSNTLNAIFSVATDTEMHLYAVRFSYLCNASGSGIANMHVNTGSGIAYYIFYENVSAPAGNDTMAVQTLSFPEPIILPAGYSLRIQTDSANVECSGFGSGITFNE